MPDYQVYMVLTQAAWVLFVFAFGACVGSLINVLVYRLPLGMSVITPPSRCPACDTRLTWRENIPIFGWIFLRGRCRFCKSKISPEYPLVEFATAFIFAAFFVLWYLVPPSAGKYAGKAVWLGIDWGSIRPDWTYNDIIDLSNMWPSHTWPMFLVLIVLVGSLIAMTIVDFKTFTIPLVLPWFATIVGLGGHAGYALYWQQTHDNWLKYPRIETGWIWSIATPQNDAASWAGAWWWVGASIGGILGLGVGMLLLRLGLIRRSFSDYEEWEKQALAEQGGANQKSAEETNPDKLTQNDVSLGGAGVPPAHVSEIERAGSSPPLHPNQGSNPLVLVAIVVGLTVLGVVVAGLIGKPQWWGLIFGAVAGPLAAGLVHRAKTPAPSAGGEAHEAGLSTPAMWIRYPHARREMLKEMAFLGPCAGLAILGGWLTTHGVEAKVLPWSPPLPLLVLTGVLIGYLIGGGVVWLVRIGGSLAFGKEAMGLGDVHLMAAVGACLGWIDSTLAFFLAAFVGLYWTIMSAVWSRSVARQMPYGPYLAAATVLVVLCKPLIEVGLTRLLQIEPGGMPINLP